MKESASASHIRLDAAQQNIDLWRNNVGVLKNKDGVPVRYGLCNESAAVNKIIKSSDLIGITPVIIQPYHVGQLLGVFTAVETKATDWVFNPTDEHTIAQLAFHDIVMRAGGYSGFARNVDEFRKIIRR